MGASKIITTLVLALKTANTGRGTKCKANVVCNVGGLSLCPNMAIILLVHAVQRLGPGFEMKRLLLQGGQIIGYHRNKGEGD